ncbi:MAG: hypothetical protein ABSD39_08500 [Terriglobales bacterium]
MPSAVEVNLWITRDHGPGNEQDYNDDGEFHKAPYGKLPDVSLLVFQAKTTVPTCYPP